MKVSPQVNTGKNEKRNQYSILIFFTYQKSIFSHIHKRTTDCPLTEISSKVATGAKIQTHLLIKGGESYDECQKQNGR